MKLPIPGHHKYHADDSGSIYGPRSGDNPLHFGYTKKGRKGYRHISISYGMYSKPAKVHILIALTFLGPRPPGMVVNHKDGDKENNSASNLEYISSSANIKHAYDTRLHGKRVGEQHATHKLKESDVLAIIGKCKIPGINKSEIAREYHCSRSLITFIEKGIAWKHLVR